MANETAADGLGESTTDEHSVLCVSMVTGWKQTRKGCVYVFVRNFRAQQHMLAATNAQCMRFKNSVKESVDDDPVQWLFLH